jgi:virulence-associated protein VagC
VGNGVLLEPVASEAAEWFAALDRFDDPFMPEGRDQPLAEDRDIFR